MLLHLILGLLRNGEPRHGYQLVTQHRGLTGIVISPGNVYRALSRLASRRLVQARSDEPAIDGRRIPYQITEYGRDLFDQWLLSPAKHGEEFSVWLLFADRVPLELRNRVLERARDMLWSQCKALERAREDAVAKHSSVLERYHPLPVLLSRRLKQATADLEFLNELRAELTTEAMTRASDANVTGMTTRPERPAKSAKRTAR